MNTVALGDGEADFARAVRECVRPEVKLPKPLGEDFFEPLKSAMTETEKASAKVAQHLLDAQKARQGE